MQICTVYAFISAIELPRIPAYLPKLIFYLHWIFSKKICGNEGDRHYLETLGFIEGATVRIVSILLGSYIVRIQESKIGISQDFTKMIIVQV